MKKFLPIGPMKNTIMLNKSCGVYCLSFMAQQILNVGS
jgi:hypothetical protein